LLPPTCATLARNIASKPFEPPDEKLPDALKNLNYDQYRSIRFLPEHALWRSEKLPFQAQFFHRGFFYKNRVDLHEVTNRRAVAIKYRRDDFSFGPDIGQWPETDLSFAGFRIHAPINKPDYFDEVCTKIEECDTLDNATAWLDRAEMRAVLNDAAMLRRLLQMPRSGEPERPA
jgi:glucans biosynthesis protein